VLDALLTAEGIGEIALIVSCNGHDVAEYEKVDLTTTDSRVKVYSNDDMFAPPASGSAGYDAMVIVPCSMGSAGRIASGVSGDLIGRAADVMLKERRKLIVAVRETPFSTIHLRNLTTLSECGAVVLPASPAFYSHPATIEALCDTVVERIVMQLGIEMPHYAWGGE
jgi:4-hydroxy-3-polyprenylbenzoate decarboxylase